MVEGGRFGGQEFRRHSRFDKGSFSLLESMEIYKTECLSGEYVHHIGL